MLTAERIFLRPLEEEDLHLRVKWVNDPEVRETLMFDYPLSLAKTKVWFHKTLMDSSRCHFSINDRETGRTIGMTGLLDIDYKHRRAQLYITIGEKEFWGKRLADEIIPLVQEYGFTELNLNRIYLYTLQNNSRGRKVYERNGFSCDGTLRQHYFCVREYQDLTVHSILRSEWEARVGSAADSEGA